LRARMGMMGASSSRLEDEDFLRCRAGAVLGMLLLSQFAAAGACGP